MSRKNYVYFILLGLITFAIYKMSEQQTKNQASHELPKLGQVTNFSFNDQSGKEFQLDSLKGNILIIDFFFTRCTGPCPLMTKKMAVLQETFKDALDVHMVSVSVDPNNDTPEVLQQYATTFQINPDKWHLLTGNLENATNLFSKQLKLAVGEGPDLHSTKFILLDQTGTIRGYYDSSEAESLQKLEKAIHDLRSKPASV